MAFDILGIGITGKSLTELERRIIRETSPYAVVLFGRNIESVSQLRALVAEVKSLAPRPPLLMIDEEGGRVDRLRNLLPGLPSAEAFGEGDQPHEMSSWAGRIIGSALRFFDIEVDLAPVVDIRGAVAPKGLERRTFGSDATAVVDLAGAFLRGLHSGGTASCLKHFPGIGLGSADSHYGTTIIDITAEELMRRDLVPFARLGSEAGAILIGHGTYPALDDEQNPATLSRRIATELLRGGIGFEGAAISDDMEMHAVSDLGPYEEIADRALMAGNDVILFCSHIERVPDLQRHLGERAARGGDYGARHAEAVARAERYRAHCYRIRDAVKPPASFDAIVDEMIRFSDAFRITRPAYEEYVGTDRRHNPRTIRGRTGREEWT
jgi:beta-N-acetylhexosaminidase